MKRRPKRKNSILLKALILVFCVYMITTFANLLTTLNESQAQLEELKNQYNFEKESIEELKELLSDKSNKKIIEKAARERLGYIYSNEQVFVDISGS